jgi:hypothetical protein
MFIPALLLTTTPLWMVNDTAVSPTFVFIRASRWLEAANGDEAFWVWLVLLPGD